MDQNIYQHKTKNQLNRDNFINVTITNKISQRNYINNQDSNTQCKESVRNRDQTIIEELNKKIIHIAVLKEKWLKYNTEDKALLNQSDTKQGNSDTLTHNRPSDRKGGGIAIAYQKTIQNHAMGQMPHVNHAVCYLKSNHEK